MVPSDDASGQPPARARLETDGGADATDRNADPARGDSAADRTPSGHGVATPLLAGALGGLVGAAAFGAMMWLVNPEFLRSSIPALYGLEPRGTFGWSVHLLHGVVLGLVFGAVVSRDAVRETLVPTDPDRLGPGGLGTRLVAGGIAFGIAVWAIIPVLTLPILTDIANEDRSDVLAIAGTESLAGHALFGLLLGVVYAVLVARR